MILIIVNTNHSCLFGKLTSFSRERNKGFMAKKKRPISGALQY